MDELMQIETTHVGTFDDAIGCWIGAAMPFDPDPSGECWFWRMDRALIMYMLKRLMVTRWGPKKLGNGTDVASREMRIRYRMRAAKEQTDRTHAMRRRLCKIGLYWESIASTWLFALSQTCRGWRKRVREFRETVGVGYMIDDAANLQRVLFAEQKVQSSMRIREHVNTSRIIMEEIAKSMRVCDEIPLLVKGQRILHSYEMTHQLPTWTLLDVWNRGGKKAFKKLVGVICDEVQRVVRKHTCHCTITFVQKSKRLRLCEKTCEVTTWLVELPEWRRR